MKVFVNLTHGKNNSLVYFATGYIRIQSTACEQKRWDFIIRDLDHNFLYTLSQGEQILVIDCSSRKKQSRALYQGIEWIKFCLNREWFGNYDINVKVKKCNVFNYFNSIKLSNEAKHKLKYYRKFLKTEFLPTIFTNCEQIKEYNPLSDNHLGKS